MLRSGSKGYVSDVQGAFEALGAFEQTFDGEELEAGVFGPVAGGVEAGFGSFALHGSGGFGEGDVCTDVGLLAVDDADEVADLGYTDVLAGL